METARFEFQQNYPTENLRLMTDMCCKNYKCSVLITFLFLVILKPTSNNSSVEKHGILYSSRQRDTISNLFCVTTLDKGM